MKKSRGNRRTTTVVEGEEEKDWVFRDPGGPAIPGKTKTRPEVREDGKDLMTVVQVN
jgi:hypothetical protein